MRFTCFATAHDPALAVTSQREALWREVRVTAFAAAQPLAPANYFIVGCQGACVLGADRDVLEGPVGFEEMKSTTPTGKRVIIANRAVGIAVRARRSFE